MLTQYLIHMAILAYLPVSSGHGIDFDLLAGRKPVAKTEEKVVLRETTLSEKCELGLETVSRPDSEIAALQADVGCLRSALGLCQRAQKPSWETPNLHAIIRHDWNEQFSFSSDDDGGFSFGGRRYPAIRAEEVVFGRGSSFW